MSKNTNEKFAVVGIGGVFPDAANIEAYWKNITDKRVSIERISEDCVEREVFYRPEVYTQSDKGDRSYTDLRATIQEIDFNPLLFRIPPTIAKRMDDNQKLSLMAAKEAIDYGGLESVSKDRVAVFMGNTMIGQNHHHYIARFDSDKYAHYLARHPLFDKRLSPDEQDRVLCDLREKIVGKTIGVTEDTAPGVLPNIIAARINAVFDLHGHAYVIDAACASGLAAIICGIQQLRLGEADAVVCGAADYQNEELGRIYFCGLGALSPDGSFPFDARANGFVIGDGAGAVVIKRLDDAIEAKDKIFCVITGYGQASDGKGKAIAAPNNVWQAETIKRAWEMASVSADTIELIEAHGTSTEVGDVSEVKALKGSFDLLGAKGTGFCGIGSVKSNIGHLKSAAGIAGFLKAVIAVEKGILPPTAGFEKENPELELKDSPFYVLKDAKKWEKKSHPRRAGVSAFGFGGADYHIAIEEYREADYKSTTQSYKKVSSVEKENSHYSRQQSGSVRQDPDRCDEAILFSGENAADVQAQLLSFVESAKRIPENLNGHIIEQNLKASSNEPCRLALVFQTIETLEKNAQVVAEWAGKKGGEKVLAMKGVSFSTDAPCRSSQVAVMFPGQGSQYADMLESLIFSSAAGYQLFQRADALWQQYAGHSVLDLVDSAIRGQEETELLLRQTQNTHPAMVISSLATYCILEEMGLKPGVFIGHSVGELTALTAAKRMIFKDAISLVHARGSSFAKVPKERRGGMAALALNAYEARNLLEMSGIQLAIANVNAPMQTIVSGDAAAIEQVLKECKKRDTKGTRLNVSHAFHSPLMVPAERTFQSFLDKAAFQYGDAKVIENQFNGYYGSTPDAVRDTLRTHITGTVNFTASIERLYAEGARVFVEVGPSAVLSSLVRKTLEGKDITVLSSDNRRGDSREAFLRMVCGLFAAGIPIDPTCETRRGAKVVSDGSVTYRRSASQNEKNVSPIVYSGVSVGLPGSFKRSFGGDNFEQLFNGKNCIEKLNDLERQRMVDLNISKVVKSEEGASFTALSSLNEVIQLVGKMGKLSLVDEYMLEEKDVSNMSNAIALAVAAGFEALRDARIPLVHEYSPTMSGALLPERWALPKEMQAHTGVIFANGFPMVDPIIREVSRHLSIQLGNKAKDALFDFYDALIPKVTDAENRRLLTDWYVSHQEKLGAVPSNDEVYNFNRNLMNQIAMQANNRLASYINARGPNFQINGACSSTATAVTLAESLILAGRAKRMIVIGGDDPASKEALPYLGGGFLSTGACTNNGDLYSAAVPFDKRRNGMIMGAGAVGIVLENDEECAHRGVIPVCELLGSHCFNSAGHSSQLDIPRYAEELDVFVSHMEKTHGLHRQKMASKLLYLSHETYTPPRGGCSESEAVALQHVFGDAYGEIEIGNTKGMTGHTMGASIEDAAAAKSLQFGRVPPVVNHKVSDPALKGLKLSKGEPGNFEYALRMAAGFGSQGNYILLRQRAKGKERVASAAAHREWLEQISGNETPELIHRGRILAVSEGNHDEMVVDRPYIESYPPCRRSSYNAQAKRSSRVSASPQPERVTTAPVVQLNDETISKSAPSLSSCSGAEDDLVKDRTYPSIPPKSNGQNNGEVNALVLEVVASVTGYDASILEPDMDLEADLGIDTVKQATILATLSEKLGITELQDLRLSEYPTLAHIITLYEGASGDAGGSVESRTKSADVTPQINDPMDGADAANETALSLRQEAAKQIIEVISEITGYAQDILDESMELEADLGVDTIKQATILAALSDKYGIESEQDFKMSDFASISQLINFFLENRKNKECEEAPETSSKETEQISETNDESSLPPSASEEDVYERLCDIMGSLTPYPSDMIEADLALKSDLQLDVETVSALESALVDAFGLPKEWCIKEDVDVGTLSDSVYQIVPSLKQSQPVSESIGRQILKLIPADKEGIDGYDLASKRAWIVGDDKKCVAQLARHLEQLGCKGAYLVFPKTYRNDQLMDEIEALISKGAPDLLVDLTASPSSGVILQEGPETVLPSIERAMEGRFVLCKRLAEKKLQPERVLVVTGMDGSFGLSKEASSHSVYELYGLHTGFYKAIRKEWLDTTLSILDLSQSSWEQEGQTAVERIQLELQSKGVGVEVCYIDGKRHRVVVEDIAAPVMDVEFEQMKKDDVVVVTGGGTGITAQIVLAMAQKSPCIFALIGRTPLRTEAKSLMFADEATLSKQKSKIQKQLQDAGERVTPVSIEKALMPLIRSAQIYETLDKLERLGAKGRYLSADVCDLKTLEAALLEIREKLGPIKTIIHGAGIEVSHPLEKKTVEEFRRVHSVKTIGAYYLNWLSRNDKVKRIVYLSSISSRFGNVAQTDYAGANGFLDVLARSERRPGVCATSLLWSGWGDVGMAWNNTFVREKAEVLGLNFISPQLGAEVAAAEILSPSGPAEIIYHRGLGDVVDQGFTRKDPSLYPFVDWVETRDKMITASHRRFSVERDAFLDQHRLGVVPLMPGVGFMEMMAETALRMNGKTEGSFVFKQLEFSDAFKLYREAPRDVRIDVLSGDEEGEAGYQMVVQSPFVSKLNQSVEMRTYSRALVEIRPQGEVPPAIANFDIPFEHETTYKEVLDEAASNNPQNVFFGPLFNEAKRTSNTPLSTQIRWGNKGIETLVPLPQEQVDHPRYPLSRLAVNPAFLDAVHQAGAVLAIQLTGHVYLPVGAEEFIVYSPPNRDGRYRVTAKLNHLDDQQAIYDMEMVWEDDICCVTAKNIRFRRIHQ